MKTRKILAAFAGISLIGTLPACKNVDNSEQTVSGEIDVVDGNLGDAINEMDDSETANSLLTHAGLDNILNGSAPYTIFLPNDAAFEKLGEAKITELKSEEGRPELLALLRNHIAPGSLGEKDIIAALENNSGSVKISTVGGSEISLTKKGRDLMVGGSDETSSQLVGQPKRSSNGVVYNVNALIPPPTER
jgi:uncharacterized surface protein with fasciclin (FAS1) repeats